MKKDFFLVKASIIVLSIIFSVTAFSQNVAKTGEPKSNTGKAVIVGKDGAAYKIGTKPIEVFYESTGLTSDFTMARQKTNGLSMEGSTGISGVSAIPPANEKKITPALVAENRDKGNSSFFLTGEPVPGAEIYVELEQDKVQKKIPFSAPNPLQRKILLAAGTDNPGKIGISVKLSDSCFPWFIQNGKKMISSGIYVFGLETTINKVKNFNEFVVVIHEPVQSFLADMPGPFSQSLSNIEDNGKLVNPASSKELEIEAKVFLVNSFTNVKKQ
jgi:hypothetical protein